MALHGEPAATSKLQKLALLSDSKADNTLVGHWTSLFHAVGLHLHMGRTTNDKLTRLP